MEQWIRNGYYFHHERSVSSHIAVRNYDFRHDARGLSLALLSKFLITG
jgi:hypothetical protein